MTQLTKAQVTQNWPTTFRQLSRSLPPTQRLGYWEDDDGHIAEVVVLEEKRPGSVNVVQVLYAEDGQPRLLD